MIVVIVFDVAVGSLDRDVHPFTDGGVGEVVYHVVGAVGIRLATAA